MNTRLFTGALVTCIALLIYGFFNWLRTEKHLGAAFYGSSPMETAVAAKPRITYAQFVAQQVPQQKYAPGTIADLIERRMEAAEKPGARPIGSSQKYTMRRLQGCPIGAKHHLELKVGDFIDHCGARKAAGVLPQTTMGDFTVLSSVIKYAVEVWDEPDTGHLIVRRARSQLMREQLIGQSSKRVRLPTEDELARLFALFEKQNQRPRNKIDMVLTVTGEILTGRRISELTRIERQHVNVEKRTCWLYNLKNCKGKGYHAEFALIEGAWELFERRLAEIPNEPTARLFPFNPHSCSARYTMAKIELGIVGLRMHDNRAKAFVRLLAKGYSPLQVRKGVSLHSDPNSFDIYARIKAEDLHAGPSSIQAVA